jgi:hypothetical protein
MTHYLHVMVDQFVCWIQTGVMSVTNLTIVGLGAAVAAVFLLLPNMPAEMPLPSDVQAGLASADYYLPMTFVVNLVGTAATLILVIWMVRIPLRWVKAQ